MNTLRKLIVTILFLFLLFPIIASAETKQECLAKWDRWEREAVRVAIEWYEEHKYPNATVDSLQSAANLTLDMLVRINNYTDTQRAFCK